MDVGGVLVVLFLAGSAPFAVLGLVRLWTADDLAALVRADLARTREQVRERWDTQPDEAPLWAEVLGLLVPLGLWFRTASHVFAAELQGIDSQPAERDVTAANAVAAVRESDDWLVDFNARVTALVAGCVLWWSYLPAAGATIAIDTGSTLAQVALVWLVLNVGVLLADPLLFVLYRSRTTDTTTLPTHATR